MRPHKPVQNYDKIRRHLERLGLWEPITLTKACTPRAPPSQPSQPASSNAPSPKNPTAACKNTASPRKARIS